MCGPQDTEAFSFVLEGGTIAVRFHVTSTGAVHRDSVRKFKGSSEAATVDGEFTGQRVLTGQRQAAQRESSQSFPE